VGSWLAIVRHGESTGNLAMRRATADGLDVAEIPEPEADIPLSPAGREQAAALGRRLAASSEHPTAVLASPYVRAAETARIALAVSSQPTCPDRPPGPPIILDERLRDREMGRCYRLTPRAIAARHPGAAGDFHHRPPGGESWADVARRLRAALTDLERDHPGGRVLVFAHDVIVLLTRYLLEHRLPDVEVANGSISIWSREGGEFRLVTFNSTDHLRAAMS
jgi:broad specificity phosphatase PhoE